MPRISVLPPEVVNRIAAGEVVERPASLVKELVENSIDAHSTEVEIDLVEGGRSKVSVRDNGVGMDSEDLALAFESHATSKLRLEDTEGGLFGVATLGFRGEALASIGAVADVEVVSRTPKSDHGFRYRPGRSEPEPAASPQGTTIEVANLFYNVPARRKFLRAASTELSQVLRQVTRLALGFPSVRFRVTHAGRKSLEYPAASSLRERVEQVVGAGKADQLIEVREGDESSAESNAILRGFVGTPSLRRNDSREQHFFVNGRWVKDRTLSHALRSAFQGFLIPGFYPVAYLYLEFPPDAVDVNVHPTKSEVRFRDSASVYPLIYHAVKSALAGDPGEERAAAGRASRESAASREAEAQIGAQADVPPSPGNARESSGTDERSESRFDGPTERVSRESTAAEVAGSPSTSADVNVERHRAAQATRDFLESDRGGELQRGERGRSASGSFERSRGGGSPPSPFPAASPSRESTPDAALAPSVRDAGREIGSLPLGGAAASRSTKSSSSGRAFQLLDTYIVVDGVRHAGRDAVLLIDQHALHEKILYEDIFEKIRAGKLLRQKLIVPDVVEIPVEAVPLVDKAAELLDLCGYSIELFGDREVAVHAVPKVFDRVRSNRSVSEFVSEAFRWLEEEGAAVEEVSAVDAEGILSAPFRRLASIMACKRAVKAGTRLDPQEIASLLEKRDLAEDPRHCPHGRPTTVRLDRRELDAMFDRK